MVLKVIGVAALLFALGYAASDSGSAARGTPAEGAPDTLSFKKDVFPLIEKHCLPCHAGDSFNPSELVLDSYGDLMSGGKHGKPVAPGDAAKSLLVQKLSLTPPFGDRMPFNSRRKIKEGRAKWLTPAEIETFARWVDQGAKDN